MGSPRRNRSRRLPGGGRRPGPAAGTSIRGARLADAPALARVMRASIRALARSAYGSRQIAAWSSLPALYHAWSMSAGGETVFVAESAGRILGYAALREGEVTALFVLPSAARRGLGSRLLGRVEREARRRGATRLVVRASRNGLPFYRALGFAGSRAIRVPLPGGGALRAVLLVRRMTGRHFGSGGSTSSWN